MGVGMMYSSVLRERRARRARRKRGERRERRERRGERRTGLQIRQRHTFHIFIKREQVAVKKLRDVLCLNCHFIAGIAWIPAITAITVCFVHVLSRVDPTVEKLALDHHSSTMWRMCESKQQRSACLVPLHNDVHTCIFQSKYVYIYYIIIVIIYMYI